MRRLLRGLWFAGRLFVGGLLRGPDGVPPDADPGRVVCLTGRDRSVTALAGADRSLTTLAGRDRSRTDLTADLEC